MVSKASGATGSQGTSLVVVTANLEELRNEDDLRHPGDLDVFVERALDLCPAPPDVVLLQEVVEHAARHVGKALRERTRRRYSLPARPGQSEFVGPRTPHETIRDTAILLNLKTMKKATKPLYVPTRYKQSDKSDKKLRVKEHAHMLAVHKASGTNVAIMSVHPVANDWLKTKERAYAHRAQAARELCELVESTYRKGKGKQIRVIGGDFNTPRCSEGSEKVDCEPTEMWKVMTEDYGYKDAAFEIHGGSDRAIRRQHRRGTRKPAARIDYIFTDAGVLGASHDIEYDALAGQPGYYSDHRFVWAELRLP